MGTNRLARLIAVLAVLASAAFSSGCGYMGSARAIDPAELDRDPGWIAVRDVRFQAQSGDRDCGAAALAMVLTYWGHPSTPEEITSACPLSEEGSRAGSLRDLVRTRGLKGFLIYGNLDDLNSELGRGRPVIVGLVKPYINGGMTHYEVVVAIHPQKNMVATLDPVRGPRQNSFEGFLLEWEPAKRLTLVVRGDESKKGASGRGPSVDSTQGHHP